MQNLNWPEERVCRFSDRQASWFQPGSNYCLDFHGDPLRSELVVYSDGNHHMALQQVLESFRQAHDLESIFYCTVPPAVYLQLMRHGFLDLGNLRISSSPHLVIGPREIVDGLLAEGRVESSQPFVRSAGFALLVAKQNPLRIDSVAALFDPGVRLFISNPQSEQASFEVYRHYLGECAAKAGIAAEEIEPRLAPDNPATVFGERIHHREAPTALARGEADVALLYRHLALRCVRVFPQLFEMIELPDEAADAATVYHFGLADSGNTLALQLSQYLLSEEVQQVYRGHGLSSL